MSKHTYKSWFDGVRKYLWNDEKTPYRIPVAKLHRGQADNEIFAFSLFFAVLFGIVAVVSLTGAGPHGRSPGVSLYAFTVMLSAVALGLTKHMVAAGYCGLAPLVALGYFFIWGFPDRMETIDEAIFILVALVFLRYAWRLVAITQIYDELPSGPGKQGRG